MLKKGFVLFLLVLIFAESQAQQMSSIRTRFSDSFGEWDLFAFVPETEIDSALMADPEEMEEAQEEALEEEYIESEEVEESYAGYMRLRWVHKEDWTDWDYEFGEATGSIRQKWTNDPTQWELRSYEGDIVTIRQLWKNDVSQWVVTDNEHSFTFKSRYTNTGDEWITSNDSYGSFYMYTLFEGDPRDWAIEDNLDAEISAGIRMAFVFLTTFVTSPK